jgi:hypothetical protein
MLKDTCARGGYCWNGHTLPLADASIGREIAVVRFVDPLAGAIRSSDLGSGWMHKWQVGQAPVGTPMGKMQQGQGFSGGAVRRAAALHIEKFPWKASRVRQLRIDDGSGAIWMAFSIFFLAGSDISHRVLLTLHRAGL